MKIPTHRKMTFGEFVASEDSEEGQIDESWLNHWKEHIPTLLSEENTKEHCGDCTKVPAPCILCTLEILLKEYKEYYFGEKIGDKK